MAPKLWCDKCGEWLIPVEGVTATYQRGYWWCAKHVNGFYDHGEFVVGFPGDGKLTPETILTADDPEK